MSLLILLDSYIHRVTNLIFSVKDRVCRTDTKRDYTADEVESQNIELNEIKELFVDNRIDQNLIFDTDNITDVNKIPKPIRVFD